MQYKLDTHPYPLAGPPPERGGREKMHVHSPRPKACGGALKWEVFLEGGTWIHTLFGSGVLPTKLNYTTHLWNPTAGCRPNPLPHRSRHDGTPGTASSPCERLGVARLFRLAGRRAPSARRLVFGERELPGWCHFAGTSLRELPLLERPRADDSLLILASPFGETFAVGGHRTST